jgi:hypothetical protein
MKSTFIATVLVIGGVVVGSTLVSAGAGRQLRTRDDHIAWVGDALKRMETIKPGMRRKELLVVFTTEGGLSTPLHRTFVSRDCPYFKVDAEFDAVGRPNRDGDGRGTIVESDQDRIIKISRPYLEFGVID